MCERNADRIFKDIFELLSCCVLSYIYPSIVIAFAYSL